jgi:hypothetical protein
MALIMLDGDAEGETGRRPGGVVWRRRRSILVSGRVRVPAAVTA